MKSMSLAICPIFCVVLLQAQTNSVEFKNGIVLEYTVYPPGTIFPLTIVMDSVSADFISMKWTNANGIGGRYILTAASLHNADSAYWGPPDYNQEVVMNPGTSLLFLSQKQWRELKSSNQTVMDGHTYRVKKTADENQLTINGKLLNVILLESIHTGARLWILDNANFPLMLKIENNPMQVDLELTAIKN